MPAWEDLLGYLNKITGRMWYAPGVQERVSFANYWRDPNALELYRSKSAYLADLNNERPVKNSTYAANMASLDAFVLVASSVDAIIVPRESSWFSFYEPNSTSRLLPLRRTALYRDDWIGLRSLEAAGKLHFASISCGHREAPTEQCRMQIWDAATKRFVRRLGAVEGLLRWLRPAPDKLAEFARGASREAARATDAAGGCDVGNEAPESGRVRLRPSRTA